MTTFARNIKKYSIPVKQSQALQSKGICSLKGKYYLICFLCFFCFFPLFAQVTTHRYFSTYIDNSVTVDLSQGCTDFTLSMVVNPLHGTLSGTISNGSFMYTPVVGFKGKDSLKCAVTCTGNSSFVWVYFISFPDNIEITICSEPPPVTQWDIREGNSSSLTVYNCAQPLVGDIDNDGKNEIVIAGLGSKYNGLSDSIAIYDEQLQRRIVFNIPEMRTIGVCPMAIADVDRDGIAEIFVHSMDGFVRCYNFNGNKVNMKWTSSQSVLTHRVTSPIIADVNADGIPEILINNNIFNAQTGVLLLTLPISVGDGEAILDVNIPVFADMDNDGLLEIVGGNTVVKVDITNPHGTIGNNAYIWKKITGYDIYGGLTSVADIDLDGFMDVVAVRKGYMYIWKPYTGDNSSPALLDVIPYNSSRYCGGRALIADINNDGYPEIAWIYEDRNQISKYGIQTYKYNPITQKLQPLWSVPIDENTLGTGMSAFDFNQDGNLEIVYRDQAYLRIFDGATGQTLSQIPCYATTVDEYPIIVDLDRDGSAEIIVTESSYNDRMTSPRSKLRSFRSPVGIKWAPARYVWNQYTYNVVHVNNDLTIPQFQFNPVATFSDPNNPSVIRRPFNNFLQQATTLNQYGVPFIPTEKIYTYLKGFTCQGRTYTEYGFNIDKEITKKIGVQHFQQKLIASSTGCDSIVYLELMISPNYETTINTKSCESYTYNGQTYTQSGNYTQILTTYAGCEEVISLKLTIFPNYENEIVINACNSYNWNGTIYTESGDYTQTFKSVNGCDSLVHLKLNIQQSVFTNIEAKACNSYNWNGTLYAESGDYTQIFKSVNGCDSVVYLKLNIYQSLFTNIEAKACNFYVWNGKIYKESGDYTQTFKSVNGCDSIVHVKLNIQKPISTNIEIKACNFYTWNAQTYYKSGDYTQTFKSVDGCDSTVHLKLTIVEGRDNISIFIYDTISMGEDYRQHGFKIDRELSEGNYTFQLFLKDMYGCDSTVNLILQVNDAYVELDLPNAFLPEEPYTNNYFFAARKKNIGSLKVEIYNRWGSLIFQSSDIDFKWNGRDKDGIKVPQGAYAYKIEYHSITSPNRTLQKVGVVNVIY